MAKYRSHKRKIPKERTLGGYKVSWSTEQMAWVIAAMGTHPTLSAQAALNNPSTSKEARAHARKQLILVSSGAVSDAG